MKGSAMTNQGSRRRVGFMVPSIFNDRPFGAAEYERFIAATEAGGASSLMVGDHMNYYTSTLECFTLLSFIAARASVRVGTNVVVLPLRQPYLVAKMASTVAHLAPAGFVLGIGVGGEHAIEFDAFGLSVEGRGARTDEGLTLIRRLLESDGDVEFDGRFVQAHGAHLDPKPTFPILIGGRSEPALRRAARYGDGWSAAWVRAKDFAPARARIEELTLERERDPSTFEWVAHARVALGADRESAWQTASHYLARYYNADPAPFRAHTIAGSAEEVAEGIAAYHRAGANEVMVTVVADDLLAGIESFVADVMPLLKDR